MAIIPVEVQRPCEPKSARIVGYASDEISVAEVAVRVGVPNGCLLDGKIMQRKGVRKWSLVAHVRFNEQPHGIMCPHCGHKF